MKTFSLPYLLFLTLTVKANSSTTNEDSETSINLTGYRLVMPRVPFARAERLCEKFGHQLASFQQHLSPYLVEALEKAKISTAWAYSNGPLSSAALLYQRAYDGGLDLSVTYVGRRSNLRHRRHAVLCKVIEGKGRGEKSWEENTNTSISTGPSITEPPSTTSTESGNSQVDNQSRNTLQDTSQSHPSKASLSQSSSTSISSSEAPSEAIIVSPGKHPRFKVRINGQPVNSNAPRIQKLISRLRHIPLQSNKNNFSDNNNNNNSKGKAKSTVPKVRKIKSTRSSPPPVVESSHHRNHQPCNRNHHPVLHYCSISADCPIRQALSLLRPSQRSNNNNRRSLRKAHLYYA